MSYFLFLDDIRKPSDVKSISLPPYSWLIVRNYSEFCKIVNEKGIPEYVSYDHDLSLEHYTEVDFQKFLVKDYKNLQEKTGYDCAKFLVGKCLDLGIPHPNYQVHSMNPVGKSNVISFINAYNRSLVKKID